MINGVKRFFENILLIFISTNKKNIVSTKPLI